MIQFKHSKEREAMQTDINKLSALSSTQWGLVTTAQAELAGVGRLKLSRYADKGLLVRLSHGVYRDAGAFETDFEAVKVAWLSIDPGRLAEDRLSEPDIIVGGTTAAMVLGCGDMEPYPYLFYTLKRKQTQRRELSFVRSAFGKDDYIIVDGLPVARIEFVIADLIKRQFDISLVLDVFKDARVWLNDSSITGRTLNQEYLEGKLEKVAKQNQFNSGSELLQYMLDSINEGEKEYDQALRDMLVRGEMLDVSSITKSFQADIGMETLVRINSILNNLPAGALPTPFIDASIKILPESELDIENTFAQYDEIEFEEQACTIEVDSTEELIDEGI